ncbi:platelet glycoprotein VI isoform X1 [Moschus berezovskii]|uniref:platelet glycoprotein VI isoform X1 n=1 Tax=Moschus berezovskii TaxID=68408 RepID=UPI002443E37A|nr:platelet glycoprotein VI isoform X1 [Moschus berezovskii]
MSHIFAAEDYGRKPAVFCWDHGIWAQTDLPEVYRNPLEERALPVMSGTSAIGLLPLLFLLLFFLCLCCCGGQQGSTDNETKSQPDFNSSNPGMDFSEENPGGIARTLLNPKPATPLGLYFCEKEFLLAFDWGEGLCLGQVIRAQEGPLSKPSLQALPSSLVPLGKPVTIRCQGPPGADLYRLEKLKSGRYFDQAEIFISAMERDQAGRYRCSYQIGMLWSPPSSQLELVATGTSPKPSLSAQPSTAVPTGVTVTLRCQSQYGFDQFALYKEGDTRPFKTPERWYRADFPIVTVTAAHSGIYRCYSFSSAHPYLWSAPSDPLELVVTGTSVTPSWLPTEPPSTVTEASRKLNHLILNEASTTEAARNITVFPKESDPPTVPPGLALQCYTKGNLARICLGAVVLILLVGLLAEDWHSRRKPPMRHQLRAAHRPLPPVPQTQKPQGHQDGGRPDGPNHGFHHSNPRLGCV